MTASAEHDLVVPEWTLADRLRKARQTVGLDQRRFADVIQVKASALAQWEAGRAQPRDLIAVARRVELATRVPAAWLLGVETPTPRKDGPGGGSAMLPRLDSNQQPPGYASAQVVALASRRAAELEQAA